MGVKQWFGLAEPTAVEGLLEGERVLARRTSEDGTTDVVASTLRVLICYDGVCEGRSWCEVAGAGWTNDGLLTVLWADGSAPAQVQLGRKGRTCAQVVRERVDASVVAVQEVEVGGRSIGHVALRKDPATGAVFPQEIWGRAGRRTDPVQQAAMQEALTVFDGVLD